MKSVKIQAEGLAVRETTVVNRQYTLKEVRHYTQISKCNKSHYLHKKYDDCMAILRNLISIHRFSILGTHDGYKIMVNGYGDFNHIETAGNFRNKENILASTVFARLKEVMS